VAVPTKAPPPTQAAVNKMSCLPRPRQLRRSLIAALINRGDGRKTKELIASSSALINEVAAKMSRSKNFVCELWDRIEANT